MMDGVKHVGTQFVAYFKIFNKHVLSTADDDYL